MARREELPNIFPEIVHRDAHAAVAWLQRAFGFERTVWRLCAANSWWSVFGKPNNRRPGKHAPPP